MWLISIDDNTASAGFRVFMQDLALISLSPIAQWVLSQQAIACPTLSNYFCQPHKTKITKLQITPCLRLGSGPAGGRGRRSRTQNRWAKMRQYFEKIFQNIQKKIYQNPAQSFPVLYTFQQFQTDCNLYVKIKHHFSHNHAATLVCGGDVRRRIFYPFKPTNPTWLSEMLTANGC